MNATTARRGFTLIEILIAATVLGLGVLGIAALFAGAARQQQIAFDQSSTQRVTNNIDALLSDRFERFGGGALVRTRTIGELRRTSRRGSGTRWRPCRSAAWQGSACRGRSRSTGATMTWRTRRRTGSRAGMTWCSTGRRGRLGRCRRTRRTGWSQPMRQNNLTGMPHVNPMPFTVAPEMETIRVRARSARRRPRAAAPRLHRRCRDSEELEPSGSGWERPSGSSNMDEGQRRRNRLLFVPDNWDDVDLARWDPSSGPTGRRGIRAAAASRWNRSRLVRRRSEGMGTTDDNVRNLGAGKISGCR